jgi:hypothetical protein
MLVSWRWCSSITPPTPQMTEYRHQVLHLALDVLGVGGQGVENVSNSLSSRVKTVRQLLVRCRLLAL